MDYEDDNGEYWQTVGQWEQWQEAQIQPLNPSTSPKTNYPFRNAT